jgi:WD40 repeat protein
VYILLMNHLGTGLSGIAYRALAVEQAPPSPPSRAAKSTKPTALPPQAPPPPRVVHQDAILQRMAMSPDGDVVATVGVTHDGSDFNSTVKLWDVRAGKLKRALDEAKGSGDQQIAFSRDLLAIGVKVSVTSVVRLLTAVSVPPEVRLVDAKTLELKQTIVDTAVPGLLFLQQLAFSPDGKLLALAGLSGGLPGLAETLGCREAGTNRRQDGSRGDSE